MGRTDGHVISRRDDGGLQMNWKRLVQFVLFAKLTVVVEPVESHLSILADLDEVAVGITHVAAPFPAVIV
jgi:hypothetical protein